MESNITHSAFVELKLFYFDYRKKGDFNRDFNLALVDGINKYGLYDYKVWKCQSRYNSFAIQYLLMKSKYHISQNTKVVNDFAVSKENIIISDKVYNNIITEFALECASSRYCSLSIGEVQQYVSWYIGEYDGKESILIK